MTLHEIGLKHGTDKATFHKYCDFYERHLSHIKTKSGILLELGINTGASLRMWKEWLPNLDIVGFDIEPVSVQGCQTFKVDCGNRIELLNAAGKFKKPIVCIIDDASHIWEHQRVAFKALQGLTQLYVLEDLHTSDRPEYRLKDELTVYDKETGRFNLDVPVGTKISMYKGKANDSWTAIFKLAR